MAGDLLVSAAELEIVRHRSHFAALLLVLLLLLKVFLHHSCFSLLDRRRARLELFSTADHFEHFFALCGKELMLFESFLHSEGGRHSFSLFFNHKSRASLLEVV